jgi:hypothetical protein
VTYTAKDRPGQIKTHIARSAELVVYIIAEHVQKVHIKEDVHKAAVEECVAYELPEVRPDGNEHKLPYPGTEHQTAGERVYMIFEEENNNVGCY